MLPPRAWDSAAARCSRVRPHHCAFPACLPATKRRQLARRCPGSRWVRLCAVGTQRRSATRPTSRCERTNTLTWPGWGEGGPVGVNADCSSSSSSSLRSRHRDPLKPHTPPSRWLLPSRFSSRSENGSPRRDRSVCLLRPRIYLSRVASDQAARVPRLARAAPRRDGRPSTGRGLCRRDRPRGGGLAAWRLPTDVARRRRTWTATAPAADRRRSVRRRLRVSRGSGIDCDRCIQRRRCQQ